mmetsp:Transcript_44514/g.85139  ORF Transcript_44514/g.85139 Transcript_44514/m.85139 type:complete len:463 (-) Transcript_44514:224-1612(-)|eukprot:CAMPEP_0114247390 /NCGR_PEP_ID=MMETSP0058-20121206/12997_1 /TAXON_ID=36894 /ORGANISM="Pyramimonas parkeae, CCMP726" /LENGTH=462 /DNA_ID=CAMNT_0001360693 /DNA_START=264 /DNA_END=1652 /DNA_ORIENTATION=+
MFLLSSGPGGHVSLVQVTRSPARTAGLRRAKLFRVRKSSPWRVSSSTGKSEESSKVDSTHDPASAFSDPAAKGSIQSSGTRKEEQHTRASPLGFVKSVFARGPAIDPATDQSCAATTPEPSEQTRHEVHDDRASTSANAFATWQDEPIGDSGRSGDGGVSSLGDIEYEPLDEKDTPLDPIPPPSPSLTRIFSIFKAIWTSPIVRQLRLSLSVANLARTVLRLPAMITLVLAQAAMLTNQAGLGSALGGTVSAIITSLPMLAPAVLGAGLLLKSISANAGYIMPRLMFSGVILWCAWFGNTVVQQVMTHLCEVEESKTIIRMRTLLTTTSEMTFVALAIICILSLFGVKVSTIILPLSAVFCFASKDILLNVNAGFFLLLVQPFRAGQNVSVRIGRESTWFEGKCESIDLRYTVLRDVRNPKRRLMVPNSAFLRQEFMLSGPPSDGIRSSQDDPGNSDKARRA